VATSLREDIRKIDNGNLRKILAKGPKYHELQSKNWKYNSVEDYAKKWTKREKEEVETFSEWVMAIRSFIQIRIGKLRRSMSTNAISVFKRTKVAIFTTNML
jgi:hypothetical protein